MPGTFKLRFKPKRQGWRPKVRKVLKNGKGGNVWGSTTYSKPAIQGVGAASAYARSTVPFPPMVIKRLPYHYANNVVSSTTQYNTGTRSLFYINDTNRPLWNQASTDFLPVGYDTYMLYYQYFKVRSARIHIEIAPTNITQNCTLVIYVMNSSNSIDITNKQIDEIAALDNLWTYQLSPDKPFKFNRTIDIAKLEGLTQRQMSSDIINYKGQLTLSAGQAATATYTPPRNCQLALCLINNTNTTAISIPYELDITYNTQFFGKKSQSNSRSIV